jgi:ABC-type lipoprotein release transport system permease subunit
MILILRMAWRNLWRHKRRTWLTATAMIFSNVLLVFMISLQFGSYDMMINNTLQSFSGHFQVQKDGYNDNPKLRLSIDSIESLAEQLRQAIPDTRVAARAAAFALASSEQRSYGIQVIGVEPDFEPGVSTIPGLVRQGTYLKDMNAPDIVIGTVMARNLKVGVGDEITLLGSGLDGSFAAGILTVSGIFDSGSREMDRSFAEIPLGYFQEMFAMGDKGNSIAVAMESTDLVGPGEIRAEEVISGRNDLRVVEWTQLHPGLKQAIQADMSSAWFMYGVLIILVAFSVLNTQLMSVLERTREFGMIMALGVKPRNLASLVMTETVLMAMIGFVLGIFLGWLLAVYFNTVGFSYPGMQEVAAKFNLPGKMYPSVSLFSMVLGPGVVFLFCLLASVYPALRLYRLRPVEAMGAA